MIWTAGFALTMAAFAPPSAQPASAILHADERRTVSQLPKNFARSIAGLAHRDNLVPLLVGAGATGVATLLDSEAGEALSNPEQGFGKTLESSGTPLISGALTVGLFAIGRTTDSPRFRAMTYDLPQAWLMTYGTTEIVKLAIKRERPNARDTKSFPSGHTSNAFALATVARHHFGWKVGAPAYLGAVLMAGSRLQRDEHFLSDVVGGAALGYVIARTVVRVNSHPRRPTTGKQTVWGFSPILGGTTRGLAIVGSF